MLLLLPSIFQIYIFFLRFPIPVFPEIKHCYKCLWISSLKWEKVSQDSCLVPFIICFEHWPLLSCYKHEFLFKVFSIVAYFTFGMSKDEFKDRRLISLLRQMDQQYRLPKCHPNENLSPKQTYFNSNSGFDT